MITSHLLLQLSDHTDGLLQDHQFGHGLAVTSVHRQHATQLLEGLVYIAHTQSTAAHTAIHSE